MKLSIVMMVKNEEKYLNETLSSLKPIREQIDSELIILDTGSTDKTIEIAKKYTDKVYFSEWNDDFGDMRNKSLSYATGEWLLILDADEPVVRYDKLLDFFNTNKEKKYNCGSIELFNIMSLDPLRKTSGQVVRFFRNFDGFKYNGIVHEQPIVIEPIYNNIISCDHYGYLFQDRNLKKKKLERNSILLEKQLKNRHRNTHYIHTHLAMTYIQMGRVADAVYHAEQGYNLIKKLVKYKPQDKIYSFQYQTYITILIYTSKFKKAYNVCLDYMKFDDKNIDILYKLSMLSLRLHMENDCIKYSNKYLYYAENYEKSSNYTSIYTTCETLNLKDDIYSNLANAYVKMENYDKALDIILKSDFDKSRAYDNLVKALYKTNKLDEIINIYKEIDIDNKKRKLKIAIENNIKRDIEKDDLTKVYLILSELKDEYGIFNTYRYNKEYNEKLEKIIINRNELYYYEIVNIYMESNKNIPEFLKYLHDEKLETLFKYCLISNFEFKFLLEDFITKCSNTLDINLIKIYRIIAKVLLFDGELFGENYSKIFNLYIMYSKYYYMKTDKINYGTEVLTCKIKSFEEDFINKLDNIKLIDDDTEYIRQLKELVLDYPSNRKIIDCIIEEFKNNLDVTDEVKVLKRQFIDMISNNISKDNTEQIEILLEQYKELYGIDKEILNIYGILDIYKEELDSAEINFKKALALDIYNPDTLYNIAYLKELKKEFKEAKLFYEFCRENTDEQDLINICNEKIDCLNNY